MGVQDSHVTIVWLRLHTNIHDGIAGWPSTLLGMALAAWREKCALARVMCNVL